MRGMTTRDPLSTLAAGRSLTVHLVGGRHLNGVVIAVGEGWLHLAAEEGAALINLDQVSVLLLDGAEPMAALSSPRAARADGREPQELLKPSSHDRPRMATSQAPGRAWHEPDLKALADAFLDHHDDAALAARFHRSRSQVRELRAGFECARGNLVEDEISPIARTWIERWRKVLR